MPEARVRFGAGIWSLGLARVAKPLRLGVCGRAWQPASDPRRRPQSATDAVLDLQRARARLPERGPGMSKTILSSIAGRNL